MRKSGEGSISQRVDGRWHGRVNLGRGLDGKRQVKHVYGTTREEVVARLDEVKHKLRTNEPLDNSHRTVRSFLEGEWLPAIAPQLKPRTLYGYQSIVKQHLVPAFGHLPLHRLEPQFVQRVINAKAAGGLKRQTLRNVHTVLHRALRDAVKWRAVGLNAADAIDFPRNAETPEIHPLNADEARRYIEAARGTWLEAPAVFALRTGVRRGELLGLHWADVDLNARTARITHTVQRLVKTDIVKRSLEALPTTKTKGSKRVVPLTTEVVAALTAHRKRQAAARLKAGATWENADLVFCNETGGVADPRKIALWHHRTLANARLSHDHRWHDHRHTCGTLLIEAGASLLEVARLLGHTTTQITEAVYVHWTTKQRDTLAERMESLAGSGA
jgi:integrase